MDALIYTKFLLWPLLVSVIIFWLESRKRRHRKKRGTKLPPGPKGWPVIGNLHLLARKLPHQDLAQLSTKYGHLLYLELGSRPAVVASSVKWAMEFLRTHDKEFGNRVDNEVARSVLFGSIAFTQTGDYWRQMRKIATLELLSPKKIEACRGLRLEQISKAMAKIASKQELVSIHKLTGEIVTGLMGGLIFSSRLSEQAALLNIMIEELNDASGGFFIGDFLPYLGVLDVLAKFGLSRFIAARDTLMRQILALRRSQYEKLNPECLLDVILNLQQQQNHLIDSSDQALYGLLMDLFGAGVDTTSTTVEWVMAELMKHPKKLKKVREEMEREVVRSQRDCDHVLEDKEVGRLKYLHAVLMETLRMHPPGPLLLCRESMERCVVGEEKYELPKGTLVYINAWQLGRDPNVWEIPQEFKPERFYSDNNNNMDDTNLQPQLEHGFLAFGGGRRGCPGKALGISTSKIILANLLYFFNWKMSYSSAPIVDMDEKLGTITLKKKIPLMAIPTPQHFTQKSNKD